MESKKNMDVFREKLSKLREKRKQASHLNFKEVLDDNEKSKRPPYWEKKFERDRKILLEEEEKLKAETLGQDYILKKSLDVQADELERIEKLKANKRRRDPGFIDFEAATKRQYDRLTHQLTKDTLQSPNTSTHPISTHEPDQVNETVDSKEGAEKLVQCVKQQIDVRNKKSRRRVFDDDADVDYINERNMRYNKKLERFYGGYTDEIKQNFERGTAL